MKAASSSMSATLGRKVETFGKGEKMVSTHCDEVLGGCTFFFQKGRGVVRVATVPATSSHP